MRVSLSFAALVIALSAGACSKTPAEPAPVAHVTTGAGSAKTQTQTQPQPPTQVSSASASPPAKVCIDPLPADAPAIPPPAGAKCPVDPEMGGPKLSAVEVTFPESKDAPKVTAELASKPREVERGLMYRKAIADDHGMLFRLSERRIHTFWMQNTCIPLDMMFIDDDGTIVGISEAARPLDESIRSVACPSAWVLEVNAGWSRKYGVKPGQKMTIPASAR
jgi:uncharacterized membrane protein (UPF0127 family)